MATANILSSTRRQTLNRNTLLENLNQSFSLVMTPDDANVTLSNESNLTKWVQAVNDATTFLLERIEETSVTVDKIDKKVEKINEKLNSGEVTVTCINARHDALKDRVNELETDVLKKVDSDDLEQIEERMTKIIKDKIASTFSEQRVQITETGLRTDTSSDVYQELIKLAIEKHEREAEVLLDSIKNEIKEKLTLLTNSSQNLLSVTKTNEKKIKSLEVEHLKYNEIFLKNDATIQKFKESLESYDKTLQEKIKTISNKLSNVSLDNNNTTLTFASKSPKLKPPVFKADSRDKPMRYLRELKKYIEVINVDCDEMILTIGQTLENNASAWFDIAQQSIRTFEDFENKFKARFWNVDIQDGWARKVEYDRYMTSSKFSRLEYATYVWGFAQDLERNYTETELVRKISNHFDWDVRYTVRSQDIRTQDKFFELLAFKDSGPEQRKSTFNSAQNTQQKTDNANTTTNTNEQNKFNSNKQFQNKSNFQKAPQAQTLNTIEATKTKDTQNKDLGTKPKENTNKKSTTKFDFNTNLSDCLEDHWGLPKNT